MSYYKDAMCEPDTACPRCGGKIQMIDGGEWVIEACKDQCGWVHGQSNRQERCPDEEFEKAGER